MLLFAGAATCCRRIFRMLSQQTAVKNHRRALGGRLSVVRVGGDPAARGAGYRRGTSLGASLQTCRGHYCMDLHRSCVEGDVDYGSRTLCQNNII